MSDREKLIELMNEAQKICLDSDCYGCAYAAKGNECDYMLIADHLISNGVTVQKWIPVSERLPEKYTTVLCVWSRMPKDNFYGFARYQGGDTWYVHNEGMPKVTHWMPLPEPPKECE